MQTALDQVMPVDLPASARLGDDVLAPILIPVRTANDAYVSPQALRNQKADLALGDRVFWNRAGSVVLLTLASVTAGALVWQVIWPKPFSAGGLVIDRLGMAMGLLVSALGWVTFRFSARYLEGDPRRERFLAWMLFSILSAYALMLSTHLLVLFAAWSLTSIGLHQLLTHYSDRVEAIRAARKKFLISRLGDLALLSAIAVAWVQWGILDLRELAALPSASGATTAFALLLVLAALTKSAQFPFHSWLPETMESPTPVSALMHAGIINSGAALLFRASPVLAQVPVALLVLVLVGTITATLGMLAMWAQVKVKRTLAWSTVAQMGFTMVQCGLGAFGPALLHVLSHGCYKAWSFLASGEVTRPVSLPAPQPIWRTVAFVSAGVGASIPAMLLAGWATGFSPLHSPGEMALTAILALSIGQIWSTLFNGRLPGVRWFITAAWAVTMTVGVPFLAFLLYSATQGFLSPIGAAATPMAGPTAWIAAILPVVAMLALMGIHMHLTRMNFYSLTRAIQVHALHGFYFGVIADRFVAKVWKLFAKGTSNVEYTRIAN